MHKSDLPLNFLSVGIFSSILFYTYGVLDIAPNLSDSSFYILMTQRPEDIDNHFSMFGVIWRSIAGENSIYFNRLIHLFSVLAAGGALGYWGVRLMAPMQERLVAVLAGLMSGSAYLNYFGQGLLDPSYNSLSFILYTPCLLSFVILNEEIATHLRQGRIYSVKLILSGFILAPCLFLICFIKPPAGLAVAAFMLAMLLIKNGWNAASHLFHFVKMSGVISLSGFAGISAYFTLAWLRLFSPLEHWNRFWIGYAVSQEKADGTSAATRLMGGPKSYFLDLTRILFDNWLSILVLVTGIALTEGLLRVMKIASHRRFAVLCIFVVVSVIFSTVNAYISGLTQIVIDKQKNFLIFTSTTFSVYLTIVSLCENSSFGSKLDAGSKNIVLHDLFWGALLGGFLLTFGTGNPYYSFVPFYFGAFIVAGFLGASILDSRRRGMANSVLSLILIVSLAYSFIRFEQFPYRFGGTVSEARVEVIMGESDERFRAPQQLADSYNFLSEARTNIRNEFALKDRPMLLDMTGRAPGFNIFLGLKPPRIAWLIGGYKGSERLLSFALNRLSDEEVSRAWIIIREAEHISNHSTKILNARLARAGRQFPAHYESVGLTVLAENERNVRLYRPTP